MAALFVLTLLISSGLLFLIQPMFAKLILPLLGGSPAVWNTCMVFYQAMLLLGYLYAHLSTTRLGVRRQALMHIAVLMLPLAVLPLSIPEGWLPPVESSPVPWLLWLLLVSVGLPFLVVSSSAPLLQRWFSATGHRSAHDPYFLYAASNFGSMAALLAYPTLVEPQFVLDHQRWMWTISYLIMVALTIACAVSVVRLPRSSDQDADVAAAADLQHVRSVNFAAEPISWQRRLRWVALAFVPSSLMLGVTMHLTTDIAVAPLLWVIPLALYLLTFILAFARRQLIPHSLMLRLLPIAVVVLALMLLIEATEPVTLVVAGHLFAFFVAAMVCHGELANDRPHASRLTEYYLLLSVGGVLGGVFNAIIAPRVFTLVVEYPLAIVLVCLLVPSLRDKTANPDAAAARQSRRQWSAKLAGDLAVPLLIGGLALMLIVMTELAKLEGPLRMALAAGVPALGCYLVSGRPIRFGLAVGAVLLAGTFNTANRGDQIEVHRSFFGVHRITRSGSYRDDPTLPRHNILYHGTTMHGKQRIDRETLQPSEPELALAYYDPEGPIGQVMAAWNEQRTIENVGVVGLGVGSLAAYARPGQRFTFFEIDPLVKQIAEDQRLFSYVAAARERGAVVNIILGDARLTLGQCCDNAEFDLLVLDAFSSDAIPVHLLTREAIELYRRSIKPGGAIAIHISNRYLDLQPVIGNIAASLGMVAYVQEDLLLSADEVRRTERHPSRWVLLAEQPEDLSPVLADNLGLRWQAVEGNGDEAWTDDFSNILSVMIWR